MGRRKDRDAKFQEAQRREAAEAKAEKERQRREERDRESPWNQFAINVAPNYHLATGGQVRATGANFWHTAGPAALPGPLATSGPIPKAKPKLPVESSTECIVGYRIWPLKRSYPDGYRLTAANAHFGGEITPNEKLTAECKKDAYERSSGIITWAMIAGTATAYEDHEPKPSHPAPGPDCLCGIYAYKEAVPLDPSGQPYAAGEVYLWGRIIEHSDGYRAEFAYPKRLVVVDGGPNASRIADALSLAYGVPCEEWMA